MYVFAYLVLFEDGTHRIGGEDYLAAICKEQADKIVQIKRTEIHTDDWLNVTAPTMRNILARIEAQNAGTSHSAP